MANEILCCLQLRSRQSQFRRTHIGIADAELFLHVLYELYEFRDSVEPKQRQEPAIEFERFGRFPGDSVVKEIDRFPWQRVREARDPSCGANAYCFEDRVIDSHENRQPVADECANGRDAANIRAGFLHRVKVREFSGQFLNLFRQEIGAVGDRVVVKHARSCVA